MCPADNKQHLPRASELLGIEEAAPADGDRAPAWIDLLQAFCLPGPNYTGKCHLLLRVFFFLFQVGNLDTCFSALRLGYLFF